jgi:hypothetical protein
VTGDYSAIGGGSSNFITGLSSTVAGGTGNRVTGNYSAVGGGSDNFITGNYSNILGGTSNNIRSQYSIILGGSGNTTSGDYSFIGGGRNSKILSGHSGASVLGDGQNREHVSKYEHSLSLDFASGIYASGDLNVAGMLNALSYANNPAGKTIIVDGVVGTDVRQLQSVDGKQNSTQLSKYDQFKPFTTISGAAAASATGDLIYVRAGTYAIDSQIDLNDKGHLYFEPGTTVNITNNVTGFSFNQVTNNFPVANSIRIQGHADFVLTGSAGILTIPSPFNPFSPPIVAFECNSITGPDAANGTLFNIVNGLLSVDAKTIAMTTTFTASNATVFNITGSGDVTARIPYVYCGRFVNGAGAANVGGDAAARINADIWTLATYNATAGMNLRLITTSFRIVNYNHVGVGAAFSWTENTTSESHVFRGITWGSLAGQQNITFTSSAASTTNKIIRLDQTNIMRYAATNSLSSNRAINVGTYSTFASAPATSNVTFKIGSFTVDADVNNY